MSGKTVNVPSKIILWTIDESTAQAATRVPLNMMNQVPATQFPGVNISTELWNDRVIQPANWGTVASSTPSEIIAQFQNGSYTQALALVVSWGGMSRQSQGIYRERTPGFIQQIDRTIRECVKSIEESNSIEYAWSALTGQGDNELGWSGVMASKLLHFLCRSHGFTDNPPVPIDGAVIRTRLWPHFRYSLPFGQSVEDWNGDGFKAYNRFMTAISTWANQRHWTTTQMEPTIYDHFSRP